jgi:tetratricopeptide (TPR) repeat protein
VALYDAFISYSHRKDKPIAAALQAVVQRLGKPWYRRRALRIFRDDTSLSATPSLWPTIEQALAQSRFLILLASPEAAASPWVGKEVAYWLEHKRADTLLIAVTDGELVWDNELGDFAASERMPLPSALAARFAHEPKWVDLTAYRDAADARDAKFNELGADFAAAIHGMPKEDLLSLEVRQQRRALRLASVAAVTLSMLAGAAVWQWWEADRAKRAAVAAEQVATEQKEVAQTQRDRAEHNFGIAKDAADHVVFDIAQSLRHVQGMRVESVRRILAAAQAMMDQLARTAPDDLKLQRSRSAMLAEFATTYLAAGDLDQAQAAAEESLAIVRALTAGDRSNADRQYSLAVSLVTLGNVRLAAGDRAGALAAYQESLSIRREFATANPRNSVWQRALGVSLEKVGDVRLADGDRAGALAAYQEGLGIRRMLADLDPANTGWQRDLGVSLEKIGDVRLAGGDRAGAAAAYLESLKVRRKLAATDPDDAGWQRDVSISLEKIGDLRLAVGDHGGALTDYQESLAIRRQLAAIDPSNAGWQRDLSVGLNKVGDALLAKGDRTGALAVYEEGLAIRRRLAAADPANVGWQRDLSASIERVGDARRAAGDRENALAAYEESVAIRRKLAALDPGNARAQADLAFGLYKVGLSADPARARAALREALTIVETLEREGKLTVGQRNWPDLIRERLAALPPEQAEAR